MLQYQQQRTLNNGSAICDILHRYDCREKKKKMDFDSSEKCTSSQTNESGTLVYFKNVTEFRG